MLSHGKLASPFVNRPQHSAPASKSVQQPGAGPNANKRKRKEVFNHAQKARTMRAKSQTDTHAILNTMMEYANRLAIESEHAIGTEKLSKLWMARAIAAEVARIQST
jgi:hypothetical protein